MIDRGNGQRRVLSCSSGNRSRATYGDTRDRILLAPRNRQYCRGPKRNRPVLESGGHIAHQAADPWLQLSLALLDSKREYT